MPHNAQEHVLITGATGLVGRAAVEHFAKAGYRTTAISRRTPFDLYGANFMSVDLADRAACEGAFGKITNCTRIVFTAVEDQADLVAGWLDQAHVDRNGLMLRNMVDVVSAGSPSLKHVTILQGPKAYGAHVKPIRPDSREIRDDVRDIPNFYWPQQDYLAERGGAAGWAWTIFRPSMVSGMAIGGHANPIGAIGVYAALQKARGEPLYFPSTGSMWYEATDTELMARAIDWAGTSPNAANRAFNIANGEIFALRDLWPDIAPGARHRARRGSSPALQADHAAARRGMGRDPQTAQAARAGDGRVHPPELGVPRLRLYRPAGAADPDLEHRLAPGRLPRDAVHRRDVRQMVCALPRRRLAAAGVMSRRADILTLKSVYSQPGKSVCRLSGTAHRGGNGELGGDCCHR